MLRGHRLFPIVVALQVVSLVGCGEENSRTLPNGLLVSMAVLADDEAGKPIPQPARLGLLQQQQGKWTYRFVEDPDSNVFHKAMPFVPVSGPGGVLTLGGTRAMVKLWRPGQDPELLWEADFGGKHSRMRDGEIADIYGDGRPGIAIATHDQGVVAVLLLDDEGDFSVEELDQQADTFVHEIELGDLDGDGTLEIYATPSAPNKLDGTVQPGQVVRYVPASQEGRQVVAELGDRHAKEILVDDVDGDGRDELYAAVEAVSGGRVEIRRYDYNTDFSAGRVVAEIDDTLCRFLTSGDIDGDGSREMVAAAYKSGLWLLRPAAGDRWSVESIDRDSAGFEHAAVFADLDENDVDELYVASDKHREIRRYVWKGDDIQKEVIYRHSDSLSRFTWNLMAVPVELMP